MTEDAARRYIRNRLKSNNEKDALCSKWKIRRQYLNAILLDANKRSIPTWMLAEFGLIKKRITVYERK